MRRLPLVAIAALFLAAGLLIDAARAQSGSGGGASDQADGETTVVFVPPAIGAPSERVGAGTRDATVAPEGGLAVLVPEGGGLTTLDTPPLIWRLPDGFDGVMQAQIGPVSGGGVLQRQSGRFPPGYYGLDLKRSDLRLETGEIYRWRVSLIDAASDRIVLEAWGLVERVAPSDDDVAPATAGLWYDALAPYVSIGLSGRARITDRERYASLASSAGLPE